MNTNEDEGGLLAGLRVVDLSANLSGPYGMMLLADMGADVVKIEPQRGDPHRTLLPMKNDMSLLFAAVNRNKRSVVADLKNPDGLATVMDLIETADVVFNNFRPGVMARLGLTYDVLAAKNPGLVYCSLSGYGSTGPRSLAPAYDLAIQAFGGGMSITGHPGGPPARAGIPIADLCGGSYAVIAILAALARRGITGRGGEVETSLFDSQISMLMYWAALGLNTDTMPGPQGGGNTNITPYGPYRASDGYVVVAIYGEQFWPKLCAALGHPEWSTDPRFEHNPGRIEHRALIEGMIQDVFATRSSGEWIEILEAHDVPCSPVNDVRTALLEEHTRARDLLVELEIGGGVLGFAGDPIKEVPMRHKTHRRPPLHGEHTAEVLEEWLSCSSDEVERLIKLGAVSGQVDA